MMTIKRCHLFLHTLTLKKYSTFNYFNLIDPKSLKNGGQKLVEIKLGDKMGTKI